MIFNFFKSKKEKLKQHIEKTFENYLNILKTVPDEEVGFLLDYAAEIKSTTTMFGNKENVLKSFENPSSVDKNYLIETLEVWLKHILEISETQEGLAKSGAISVWYMSIGAFVFPELKKEYDKLWAELQRGFYYCNKFDPQKDIPREKDEDLSSIDEIVDNREIKKIEDKLMKIIQPILKETNNELPIKFTHNFEVGFYLSLHAQNIFEEMNNIKVSQDNSHKAMMKRASGYVYSTKATQNVLRLTQKDWDEIANLSTTEKAEGMNAGWFRILSYLKIGDYSKFFEKTKNLWSNEA